MKKCDLASFIGKQCSVIRASVIVACVTASVFLPMNVQCEGVPT